MPQSQHWNLLNSGICLLMSSWEPFLGETSFSLHECCYNHCPLLLGTILFKVQTTRSGQQRSYSTRFARINKRFSKTKWQTCSTTGMGEWAQCSRRGSTAKLKAVWSISLSAPVFLSTLDSLTRWDKYYIYELLYLQSNVFFRLAMTFQFGITQIPAQIPRIRARGRRCMSTPSHWSSRKEHDTTLQKFLIHL